VGGLKVTEPAVDLGILAAIASSFREIPLYPETVVFGEIGLSGEVRAVSHVEARMKEAEKIGFKKVIMPVGSLLRMKETTSLDTIGVKNIHEFLEELFP